MNYLRIAALGSGIAGLSHITLQAYGHFGMHFYFIGFLAVGLVQILLGMALWKGYLLQKMTWLTVLVNGGATVFWLLTRTIMAPFMGAVEHFTAVGLTVVALQILSIVAVCIEQRTLRFIAIGIFGSLGLGFGAHVGALQLEQHFPALKGTGGHHHGVGDHTGHEDSLQVENRQPENHAHVPTDIRSKGTGHQDDDHHMDGTTPVEQAVPTEDMPTGQPSTDDGTSSSPHDDEHDGDHH